MKSRMIVWLIGLLTVPVLPAAAQVLPIGRAPQQGGVEPASCHSCGSSHGGFYGTTMWGTDCIGCTVKPGLYPPCPNPCQTTLLGELVYDVKTAVDGTLAHVFGCVFGYPCGCWGTCTCVEPACGSCSGSCSCAGGGMPEMADPMMPSYGDSEGDPFSDDPRPTPAAQPIPRGSAMRSIVPMPQAAAPPQRPAVARRVSHVEPSGFLSAPAEGPRGMPSVSAAPLRPTTVEHYQPRRPISLRRASGEQVEAAPLRQDGLGPALRFRTTE